jgi:hypothetical protein
MTKYEISRKILDLLDCDADEIIDAIFDLAEMVEKDGEIDELCNKDWSGLQGGI